MVAACTAIGSLNAARRPRYGGELRIELRAQLRTLDPQETPSDPLALSEQRQILPAVFETLVRLDDHGEPQPWLAESWTHDAARKSWIFTPRPNVILQDGTPWTPPGGSLVLPDSRPLDQILRDLARPRNAIVIRAADGSLIGTGPFRIARWDSDRSATLTAHEKYWGGRPYLDSIAIQMGRAFSEQAVDFQAGTADVVEIGLRDLRAPRARGITVFATAPMETLALQFTNRSVPDAVREALALSIDRAAIHSVLLQRQGEVSGALLPQWLSGYAFLFPDGPKCGAGSPDCAGSCPVELRLRPSGCGDSRDCGTSRRECKRGRHHTASRRRAARSYVDALARYLARSLDRAGGVLGAAETSSAHIREPL